MRATFVTCAIGAAFVAGHAGCKQPAPMAPPAVDAAVARQVEQAAQAPTAPPTAAAPASEPPPALTSQWRLALFLAGLTEPVAIVALPTYKHGYLIAERSGAIRLAVGESPRLAAKAVADVSRDAFGVSKGVVRGLALHPNFVDHRLFYVLTSGPEATAQVLEFAANERVEAAKLVRSSANAGAPVAPQFEPVALGDAEELAPSALFAEACDKALSKPGHGTLAGHQFVAGACLGALTSVARDEASGAWRRYDWSAWLATQPGAPVAITGFGTSSTGALLMIARNGEVFQLVKEAP